MQIYTVNGLRYLEFIFAVTYETLCRKDLVGILERKESRKGSIKGRRYTKEIKGGIVFFYIT